MSDALFVLRVACLQLLLQPVDREFKFRSRNHRVQQVYEFVSKPHEHHVITNAVRPCLCTATLSAVVFCDGRFLRCVLPFEKCRRPAAVLPRWLQSVKLQALFRRKKSEKNVLLLEQQRRQAAAIEVQRAFRKSTQAAARRNTWAAAPGR